MLIYSAHLPHSPALLPHLAGKKIKEFRKTRLAIAAIAADLQERRVETVVFITPHGPGDHHYFTVNFSPRYRVDFAKFGDLAARDEFSGDSELTLALSEHARPAQPIKIVTREKLDTAAAMAVLLLTKPALWPVSKKLPKDNNGAAAKNPPAANYKILPITYALLAPEALINFGHALREAIEQNHKRIALISLGDLSHGHGKFSGQNEKTDKNIIKNLKSRDLSALAAGNETDALAGWRPLLINLGALQDANYQTEILSYEQKFGAGLMAARFVF